MSELVFDIGMHNGDDTAYYLARGYRVVAVEANPSLCAAARERFSQEISAGQLSVRNIGVAEIRGEMDFWVSSSSEWSSFHAENATKFGAQATCTRVETMPFQELIEEEGTPYFVKIDIEMNDSLCLKGLAATTSRPAYLSFELSSAPNADLIAQADADIKLLESLGYRSFKCVRQNDLREITPRNVVYQLEMGRVMAGLEWLPRIGIRGAVRRLHYRRKPINGWRFNRGSSGPLGAELPGRWLTTDEILSVWRKLVAYDHRMGGLLEWFDVHAAHESVKS